ncbi:serine hydrolase domain-containing protein [Ahniella affigens]|uniref:serine hydrolase domain-containing protein n=1 Tax=Ahniella affigens TaxID=2021234 RepID=UPI001F0BDF9D|nr:serine hydrolase domain-containing protein [Ahniella affigens]
MLEEMRGTVVNGQFGFDAVGLGDVTDDGKLDYLVGASPIGKAYLYAGSISRSEPFVMNAGLTGAWGDAGVTGQGFLLEVVTDANLLVGGWYTFARTATGASNEQRWLTYVGTYTGDTAETKLMLTQGGQFLQAGGDQTLEVGTLRFQFRDCGHANVQYEVFANAISGQGAANQGNKLTGNIELTRVTPATLCQSLQTSNAGMARLAKDLQRILDQSVSSNNIVGAQASVRIPGWPVWNGVSGTEDRVIPMRSDRMIGTGSITKMLTTAAALRLVDQGRLSLDAHLRDWFPDQANVDASITVRQAMQQISGIADYTISPALQQAVLADLNRVWTPDELRREIGPPLFAPGTGWQASNSNSLLLGRIVEIETGQTLANFMQDQLFADIPEIALVGFGTPSSALATQWGFRNGQLYNYSASFFYPSIFTYRREVQASARSLAAMGERYFLGGLFSPGLMDQILQIIPDDGGVQGQTGGGLGIRRYNFLNRTLYGHSGGTGNSSAFLLFDPATGIIVALSLNQEGTSHQNSHFETAPTLMSAAIRAVSE